MLFPPSLLPAQSTIFNTTISHQSQIFGRWKSSKPTLPMVESKAWNFPFFKRLWSPSDLPPGITRSFMFFNVTCLPPQKNNKQEHSPQNNGVCNDKRKIVLICFNLIQCKVYLEVIRVLLPGCLASLLPTQTDNFALLDAVYYRSLQKTNESSKTIS